VRIEAYFSRKTFLSRAILAAIIRRNDFRLQNADFRLKSSVLCGKELQAPQSAIYNLKLGTRPKCESPQDKSSIIQKGILDFRMQISD